MRNLKIEDLGATDFLYFKMSSKFYLCSLNQHHNPNHKIKLSYYHFTGNRYLLADMLMSFHTENCLFSS